MEEKNGKRVRIIITLVIILLFGGFIFFFFKDFNEVTLPFDDEFNQISNTMKTFFAFGFGIIILIIIAFCLICSYYAKKLNRDKINKSKDLFKLLETNMDYDTFLKSLFENYQKIELAFMNDELEKVASLLEPNLFVNYKNKLLNLQKANIKPVIEDLKCENIYITEVNKNTTLEEIVIEVFLRCKDYTIDNNKQIVNKKEANIMSYKYKLVWHKEKGKKMNFCPNCGLKISKSTFTCPKCGSTILNQNNNYVLTMKELLDKSLFY